jgi:predicted DNA binding CopG/RHH family protein
MTYKLDREETQILKAFERGQLRSILKNKEQLKEFQKAAKETLKKNKRINIRLAESDLNSIKHQAADEGMPYQTLIASILHKYNIGQLIERKS